MVELLGCDGLTFAYMEGAPVVHGVQLRVEEGELLALVGPNGAGKSTFLRLLAGLLRPDAGSVRLGGAPLGRYGLRERARAIAYVPQELRSLEDVTVEGFVAQGRYAWARSWFGGDPDAARVVADALRAADLEDVRHRLVSELSGGQRQSALLARAAAQEGRVLLVDEPTSSLDLEHQLRLFDGLLAAVRSGRAAVVVTHDLNLASQYASRVILLHEGRVRAEGASREVISPVVLEPVYGGSLVFGSRFAAAWNEERPWVLAWRDDEAEAASGLGGPVSGR